MISPAFFYSGNELSVMKTSVLILINVFYRFNDSVRTHACSSLSGSSPFFGYNLGLNSLIMPSRNIMLSLSLFT